MKMNLKKPAALCLQVLFTTAACASMIVFAPQSLAAGTSNHTAAFAPPSSSKLFNTPDDNSDMDETPDEAALVAEEKEDKLRDQLLATRLDLETGHVYTATKRLSPMKPEYKDDPEFLGFDANAENYGGNWPYATELLKNAHTLAPDNQDVTDLQHDIRREHAQNVEMDFDWIKYGSSLEDVTTISGFADAGNHIIVGGDVKDNYTMGRSLRLADGRVGDFNGNREQGEVYAQYSVQNGQQFKGAVFGNNNTAGFGGYYHFLNPLGETQLMAEYRRPYWDMPEAVLDSADRDRLAFLHIIKPNTRLTIEGGAGINRYDVQQNTDVAQSVTVDFNALYRIVEEVKYHKPYVDIGYNLDAEYVRNEKQSFDDDEDFTRVLALFSREIHTPFVDVGYDFNPSTYGDITAGYEYDRIGGHGGPMFGGKITHEFTKAFDVQLRAEHGIDKAQSSNNLTTLGGYLRWRF